MVEHNAEGQDDSEADRGIADWGIDMQCPRWYLSIFYWLMNVTMGCMWCVKNAALALA